MLLSTTACAALGAVVAVAALGVLAYPSFAAADDAELDLVPLLLLTIHPFTGLPLYNRVYKMKFVVCRNCRASATVSNIFTVLSRTRVNVIAWIWLAFLLALPRIFEEGVASSNLAKVK